MPITTTGGGANGGIYSGLTPDPNLFGIGFTELSIIPAYSTFFPCWYQDRFTFPTTGLQFNLRPGPEWCTTDTAGGTPCADGDLIQWWRDRLTGIWYQQAPSAARPTLRANGIGWYADFTTSNFFDFMTFTTVRHVMVSIRQTATATNAMIITAEGQDASIQKSSPTVFANNGFFWRGTVANFVNNVATTVSGGLNIDEVYQGTSTLSIDANQLRINGSTTFGTGHRTAMRFYGCAGWATPQDQTEIQAYGADLYATV